MNLNDILRSMFGLPNRNPRQNDHNHPSCDCFTDNDADDTQDEFGHVGDIFHHFHDDMRQQMDEMHRQMEDLFKNFGNSEFPGIDMGDDGQSPRDEMLKQPDSHESEASQPNNPFHFHHKFGRRFGQPITPKPKVDEDIADIEADDIAKIYDKPSPSSRHRDQPWSQFTRQSVRVIRSPDGTVREERTVCDSEGHCETTKTVRSPNGTTQSPADDPSILPALKESPPTPIPKGMFERLRLPWTRPADTPNTLPNSDKFTDDSVFKNIFGGPNK